MKRLVVVIGMVTVLLCVAACGSQVDGSPVTSANTSDQSSDSSAPSSGSLALPIDHPCSLLSSSDLQQLGTSTPPTQDNVGGVQACQITVPHGSVGVGFVSGQGLAQLNTAGGTVTDMRIGSHQAKEIQETASGGCYVAIGVSPSLRIDISASAGTEVDPCALATTVAHLVEPHLPTAG